jgi:hypothetical protein
MTLPLNVRVHDIMRVLFRVLFVLSEKTDLGETACAGKTTSHELESEL